MSTVGPIRAALASAALVFVVGKLILWRRKAKSLPPGPSKLPFIDNLHNMPKGLDWVAYHELAKECDSDIIHTSALGVSIVMLDSFEAAEELLDNRSGIYSSRPVTVMKHELCGMGQNLTMIPYGDRFRTARRIFAKHFASENGKIYQPRQLFYARKSLVHFLETPDDFLRHLKYSVGSTSLSMTYGIKTRSSSDKYIDIFAHLIHTSAIITGAGMFLVDVIPILKYLPSWFPGAGFQKLAAYSSQMIQNTRQALFDIAEAQMGDLDYNSCFVTESLQEIQRTGKLSDIDVVKGISLTVYLASADTTWSSLGFFMLAMVCYPEVQKKLQAELDAAFGGRLPEHNDVTELPYLTAVFMEILRWRPITPIGVPHATTMDDVYNGYFIPKDSVVLANQWAMLHDPEVYPEPSTFKPERFLKDGKIDNSVRNPYDVAFGFGRRICPGRHIARSTFMITAASILSTFDLRMKTDEKGNVIEPSQEPKLSFITQPKEFPCAIVPRSAEARQMILEWAASEGDNPP